MAYPLKRITYVSEQPQEYAAGLDECDNLSALRKYLRYWKILANDAYQISMKMKPGDWKVFNAGLSIERTKHYAGDEWAEKYSAILMPEILFRVSHTAIQFGAPWGTAFIRLREMGFLEIEFGAFVWNDSPQKD